MGLIENRAWLNSSAAQRQGCKGFSSLFAPFSEQKIGPKYGKSLVDFWARWYAWRRSRPGAKKITWLFEGRLNTLKFMWLGYGKLYVLAIVYCGFVAVTKSFFRIQRIDQLISLKVVYWYIRGKYSFVPTICVLQPKNEDWLALVFWVFLLKKVLF